MIHTYLQDAVVLFGVALAVIAISRFLRIPAIVGYLITGVLVGPHGLQLIGNANHVEQFAELGVVFLLFEIGLEVSFKKLQSLGRYFFVGGPVQALGTVALCAGVILLFGRSLPQSLFLGMVISLSSTAIVMRLYTERKELASAHGFIALGILLFQDVLIVPYLLIVPLLGGGAEASVLDVALRLGGGVLVLSAAVAISRFVFPWILRYLVSTRIRELFVMGSLLLCFGAALLTQTLGFSLALGAFLAGVLIAESDYHHQVMAETLPFRDIFNSIFFISIGMLVRIDFVMQHPLEVIGVALVIVAIKAAALLLTGAVLVRTSRLAVFIAMGLSQVGEFSFVLIQSGKGFGIIDDFTYQLAIASSILTMVLTPLLIYLAPGIADRFRPQKAEGGVSFAPDIINHVIVVGFGLAGRHLATVLKATGLPYLVAELNGETVRKAKLTGENIIYGDASGSAILEECRIRKARVIVFVIPDPVAVKRGIKLARQMNPDVFIIARARSQFDIEEMRACGANEVVSEEFETSIEIFTNVLSHLRVPGNIIRTQTKLLRSDDYRMLRGGSMVGHLPDNVARALSVGTIDTFLIQGEHVAAGKTIAELAVRKNTDATIIAVVRKDVPRTNPPSDFIVEENDLLVLVGSHAQMDRAFEYLGIKKAA